MGIEITCSPVEDWNEGSLASSAHLEYVPHAGIAYRPKPRPAET